MAEYLLSVHHDYDTEFPSLEEMQPVFDAVDRFNQKVRDAGAWVFAGGLTPVQQATTVDNLLQRDFVHRWAFGPALEAFGYER